jgi:hypothetical protein
VAGAGRSPLLLRSGPSSIRSTSRRPSRSLCARCKAAATRQRGQRSGPACPTSSLTGYVTQPTTRRLKDLPETARPTRRWRGGRGLSYAKVLTGYRTRRLISPAAMSSKVDDTHLRACEACAVCARPPRAERAVQGSWRVTAVDGRVLQTPPSHDCANVGPPYELADAPEETRVRADSDCRLLQPRDDAEAGFAKDLVSVGRVITALRAAHLTCAELETQLTTMLADFLQALQSKPEPAPSVGPLSKPTRSGSSCARGSLPGSRISRLSRVRLHNGSG